MGSEFNFLPILFFAFMSQTITAIETSDITTPQSVVSGLCRVMRFKTIPASKPADKR